jgi:hypothetical protein
MSAEWCSGTHIVRSRLNNKPTCQQYWSQHSGACSLQAFPEQPRYFTPREVAGPWRLKHVAVCGTRLGVSEQRAALLLRQVAQHCAPDDAWVSLLGSVFNISTLVQASPYKCY